MEDIITILDGYTDEPSCLGVPPFIAPLPRYIYGAIKHANKEIAINYLTIDEYRKGLRTPNIIIRDKIKHLEKSKLLIIIAGVIVPGKYLRATPISLRETLEIAQKFECERIVGGAAVQFGFGIKAKAGTHEKLKYVFDFVCTKDLDVFVYGYLTQGEPEDRYRTVKECKTWSILGAPIVRQHPDFATSLVIELEAGRGCVRQFTGGCAFCSEPKFGQPLFRPPKDVVEEVKQLSNFEMVNFRLGALSCIFSYHAKGIGESETPKPNPKMVKKLLEGIRAAARDLNVLHLDNANPAVMAAHVKETSEILKIIIQNCTGGNVLSFGLESTDPKVISANNLNTTPEEVEAMIKLVNKYGAHRSNTGMPNLLPGLNFVYGLQAESKNTFKLNFEFLKSIVDQGLLLRRINLRQVLPISESTSKMFNTKKNHRTFIKHKRLVREEIDRPLLMQLIPPGTLLTDVFTEKLNGNITFGRQMGTYPILIGIPYQMPINSFFNIAITDYGYRSATGFSAPFNINNASRLALQALPGIGAKRAARILNARPMQNFDQFSRVLDDTSVIINYKNYLDF
jgi:radical SAM superfamily enzyme with C-terminal helix-hairpin-helix motif